MRIRSCPLSRWIGFDRENNRLNLTLNNQRFAHLFTGVRIRPNQWHTLICSVDLKKKQIQTVFDGRRLEVINLPLEFKLDVIDSPWEARDKQFTFANYSHGAVYRGYATNLKIFGHALSAQEIALLPPSNFTGLPTFQERVSPLVFLVVLAFVGLVVFLLLFLRGKPVEHPIQRAGE